MTLTFHPYDQDFVDQLRAGGPDANGQPAEHVVASGDGLQCRSCLTIIPVGAPALLAAARPFPGLQPYAETGPVFFCAEACAPYQGGSLPPSVQASPRFLLKAYGADDRIIYGTGQITETDDIPDYAATLLSDPKVAYVDVRSAKNNCFQVRITDDGKGPDGVR